MRSAFIDTLYRLAQDDDRIFLVVGDLGFGVVEKFARSYPRQFLNAGVAEQNMTGIAAGLALSGKTVFTYSIANFPTLRCYEQIRNDVCYHNANVKVVAVGGGFAYGALGMTHHATEDLAVMRALPRMTVVAPGDPKETEAAVRAVAELDGPCYLRLGRAGEAVIHQRAPDFRLGKALRLREGEDLAIVSTGGMLRASCEAAAGLAEEGIHARVLSMHTLKPLDEEAVLHAARETEAIVTVEEHSILGGLGSAVAELLAEHGPSGARLKRLGAPSEFVKEVGSQEYLCERLGLTPSGIRSAAIELLARKRVPRSSAVVADRQEVLA